MKLSISVNIPKDIFKVTALRAALEEALDVGATNAEALLTRPTATWKHKAAMQTTREPWARISGTDDAIYGYVSKGTKAHVIRARRGGVLAFGPSAAKTRPGSLASSTGGSGPADTFRRQVQHPGTDARKFDELAAKELEQSWPQTVQAKIAEVTR